MAAVRAVSGGCCDADVLCRRRVCECVCAGPQSGVLEEAADANILDVCLRWSLTRADCHHCSYWWNVTLVCVCVCVLLLKVV